MKAITVHVSEPVYRDFQEHAKRTDRKTAELIRDAMNRYREQEICPRASHSIRDIQGISVGEILKPWKSRADMLEDFHDRD